MKSFAPSAAARHKAAAVAVLGGVTALAAACGGQDVVGHAGVFSKPESSLVISVSGAHGATPRRWTLRCGPAGGTHPDPQGACAALARLKDPFAQVRGGIMCLPIPGGGQFASITGTWEGRKVSATFSTANGCQASRWRRIADVLGQVNPGGRMIPASGSPPAG